MSVLLIIALSLTCGFCIIMIIFMGIIFLRNPIARMSYIEFYERLQYNIEAIVAVVGETENVDPTNDADLVSMEKKVLLKVEELYIDNRTLIKMLYGKDYLKLQASHIYRALRYQGRVAAIVKLSKGLR